MSSFLRGLGRTAALVASGAALLTAADAPLPRVAYQSFTLANGLQVLVHEDHKAPIVAVNLWYHVGSKNEKEGKTGFAHLFEHLMFNGSENFNDDYFKVMEKLGATDMNGTTNSDRTNYFENVPTSALDTALWMESDRMGHLVGAINQARLDEQRGVVQNEKRQGENQPYGLTDEIITKGTYPVGHPYSWTVIGSMDHLNAANLQDVKEWFKAYYGPNNTVLVLAGDIDLKTAKEKAEKYFGSFPANEPISRPKAWVPKMTGTRRHVMQDRVPQAMLTMVWNTPELVSIDNDRLQMLGRVLGGGRTSRLYRRLIEKEQLATQANAYANGEEICGQFTITVLARPGGDLGKIEAIVKEELDQLVAQGPSEEELKRLKSRYYAGYVRSLERIGGFGGKSDMLASGLVLAGDPEWSRTSLQRKLDAKAEDLKGAGQRWLTDGCFVLEVQPYTELKAASLDADRSKQPVPGAAPALVTPAFQRATLSNGLKVVLAERNEAPVVQFRMLFEGGTTADAQAPSGPGTASLTMRMLDEGTKTRSSRVLREQLETLGASVGSGASTNDFRVNMGALKVNLEGSIELFADMVMNPIFPADAFGRVQKERLAAIAQEKNSPEATAYRVAGPMLFGKGHPYGMPLTGTGYESTVAKIRVEDLRAMHQAWFKPGSATLIVAGNVTMPELLPRLEKAFGTWPKGTAPKVAIPKLENPTQTTIYLVDKPGAIQSVVSMVAISPARDEKDEPAVEAMQAVLGGMFTSRVNMNLREDKHWTYGGYSQIFGTKGLRGMNAGASVQTDKTKESILELEKEMKGILGDKPVSAEELSLAQKNLTLSLPGSFETSAALSGGIEEILTWGLKDNYYQTYVGRVNALKAEDLTKAARKMIPAKGRTYVVVGDRSKIEKGLRELGIGEIKLVDGDGNAVTEK